MKIAFVLLMVACALGGLYAVGSFVWGQIAKARAAEQLPGVARQLGLEVDARGAIEGEFHGRVVHVQPETAAFTAPFRQAPELFLSTLRDYRGRVPPLEPFDSGDDAFDRTFPQRRASAGVAETLAADEGLRRQILALAESRSPHVGRLTILPAGGVSGVVQEGGPWDTHVPPDELETLLRLLVETTDALEARLR